MGNKVTIIGAGSVGSTIAYTMVSSNIASEIVLIDINHKKAFGEAMDIAQATPFSSPSMIYSGDYPDAEGSDVVVVTSGVPRKPGQSRLELAQTNVNIMKSIIPQIVKYAKDAVYVIVSNPVDILTYEFHKISGIPENRIIGSGTILDTARLRYRLSELYQLSQSNIHAYVFGEHGDSSFVPWSIATLPGFTSGNYNPDIITDSKERREFSKEEVEEYVRTSGGVVIENKGATFYAVALSVCNLVKTIFRGIDTALPVSHLMHGEYGIDDICLSTLCLVGRDGISGHINVALTDDEVVKLQHSAECLKKIAKDLDFSL